MTGIREIARGLGWPALTGSPTTDLGWPDEDRVSRETSRLQATGRPASSGRTDGPPVRPETSGESRSRAAGGVAQAPIAGAPSAGGASAALDGVNGDVPVAPAGEEQSEQSKEAAVQTVVPTAAPEEDATEVSALEVSVPDGPAQAGTVSEGAESEGAVSEEGAPEFHAPGAEATPARAASVDTLPQSSSAHDGETPHDAIWALGQDTVTPDGATGTPGQDAGTRPTVDARPEDADTAAVRAVSTSMTDGLVRHEGDAVAAEEALAAVVSRETAEREVLAASLPEVGADTPLAQAVAADARKRIALTGRIFPKPAQTRVMTVANQKGGVGKTTTTVNVAAALAQAGLTVLVIDIDPQGNASTALGIDHHAEVPSIYDVLVDGAPIADVVQECPDIRGLYCAPATIDLAGAEIELVSLVARETRLQKAIAAFIGSAESLGHPVPDYVFIDCPPSLGLLTVNAFVAAEEVFIPIQCEYYALEGLSQLLKNIELIKSHLNPELHVSTILLTMYDGRTRLSAQVAEEVRAHFPQQVLRTSVPRSVRISEAPSHGQTVMTYDPNSSGALSYLEAASELADRATPTP